MNLHPRNRLAAGPAFTHRGEARAIRENLSSPVAVNTSLCCREIGVRGHLDKAMAVTTIHSELFHMEGVGERNGLVGLIANTGIFRSEIIPDSKSDRRTDDQHTNKEL